MERIFLSAQSRPRRIKCHPNFLLSPHLRGASGELVCSQRIGTATKGISHMLPHATPRDPVTLLHVDRLHSPLTAFPDVCCFLVSSMILSVRLGSLGYLGPAKSWRLAFLPWVWVQHYLATPSSSQSCPNREAKALIATHIEYGLGIPVYLPPTAPNENEIFNPHRDLQFNRRILYSNRRTIHARQAAINTNLLKRADNIT